MAVLTVRNLDDEIVRRLRVQAAENGRSAEAEHREILRRELVTKQAELEHRRAIADEMTAFRRQTGGRGGPSSQELIDESRRARMAKLTGATEEEVDQIFK